MDANLSETKKALETDFEIKLEYLEPIYSGEVSDSFFSKLNGTDVVIKIAKKINTYPKEIFFYNAIRHLPIEVPEVIGYKESPEHIGCPTLIMSKIPGVPISDEFEGKEIPIELVEEMGQVLKNIHIIKSTGFGYVDNSLPELKAPYDSLREFYNENYKIIERFEYLRNHDHISLSILKKLKNTYEDILNNVGGQTILIFNDFQPLHIFTDGKHITGLIDPGNAFSCVCEHDIGTSLIFLKPQEWEIFLKGYGYSNIRLALSFGVVMSSWKAANNFASGKLERAQKRLNILNNFLKKLE